MLVTSQMIIDPSAKRRQKVATFLTHLLCITIIFVLPEVLLNLGRTHTTALNTLALYSKSLVYGIVFYLNFYVIIDRTLMSGRRNLLKFIVYNALLVVVAAIVMYVLWRYMGPESNLPPRGRPSGGGLGGPRPQPGQAINIVHAASFLLRDLVILILTIALSVALRLSQHWVLIDRQKQEALTTQREQELKSLKSQLNPHFMFNTLNTIYALISISPDKAQTAVHELSQLLRYVLYENPRTVPLQRELDFVANYLNLIRLRLSGRMPVEVTLNVGDSGECQIAPLIFINIIENIFKHGNTGEPDRGVTINISAKEGVVVCHTHNFHSHGVPTKENRPHGIGMTNLQRRLDLIYGDRASLEIKDDGEEYDLRLTIQLDPPATIP